SGALSPCASGSVPRTSGPRCSSGCASAPARPRRAGGRPRRRPRACPSTGSRSRAKEPWEGGGSIDLVHVRHVLPQRARLAAPALVDWGAAAGRVAHALADATPFARLTVRPATGSIIVEDDARVLDAPALARLIEGLLRAERGRDGRPLGARRPEEVPGPTR